MSRTSELTLLLHHKPSLNDILSSDPPSEMNLVCRCFMADLSHTVFQYTWSKTSLGSHATSETWSEVKHCNDVSVWKTGHWSMSTFAKLLDCCWTVYSSGDAYELLAEHRCLEFSPENNSVVNLIACLKAEERVGGNLDRVCRFLRFNKHPSGVPLEQISEEMFLTHPVGWT